LDPAALTVDGVQATVRGVVVHVDRADGIDDGRRRREARIMPVEDMLARLRSLDESAPGRPRPPAARLVGHCRTTSVLACAIYRELGVPARVRVGFAVYYAEGRDFNGNHWVVEVWDVAAARWRLVDAELDEATRAKHGIGFDPDDVPRDAFILAGQAWLDCRQGRARAETFGPYPDQTGLRGIAAQVVRDAASLAGHELCPFCEPAVGPLDGPRLRALDRLATATAGIPADVSAVESECADGQWLHALTCTCAELARDAG
jgi:hypothetical protein